MEKTTKRVTKKQKYMLIQHMEEYSEFSHDRFVNSTGAKSLAEQWDALAEKLNAAGGAYKNGELWKRAWVNMRSKAKQKFQDCKNALERSGINGHQKNQLTELDERVVGIMSTVAVVGQTDVGEPLRLSEYVPEVEMFEEEVEVDPRPSSSANIKKNFTCRKMPSHQDDSFLEIEREILKEKRRKNDIAEAHVNALNSINDTLLKILERMQEMI